MPNKIFIYATAWATKRGKGAWGGRTGQVGGGEEGGLGEKAIPTVWLSHLSVATPTTLTKISFLSRETLRRRSGHNNFVIRLKRRQEWKGTKKIKELMPDQNYIVHIV